MPDFTQFWDVAPPIALLFSLNFLLMFVKKIPTIPNWTIPFISFILGGAIYPLLTDPGKVSFAVRNPIAAQVLTGLLIGGAAVGSNQLFRQTLSKFGMSFGDTEIIKKDETKTNP